MRFTEENVKEFLCGYRDARFEVDRAIRKVREARELCERVTAQITGMPHGGSSGPKDGPLAAYVDMQSALAMAYENAVRKELAIEEFVNELDNPVDRHILKLRYLDMMTWEDVQKSLGILDNLYYDIRHVYRLHGRAMTAARELWEEKHKHEDSSSEN